MSIITKPPLDLAALDSAAHAEEGAELTLLHPATQEPLDIAITLAGADSAIYRKAQSRSLQKSVNSRKRLGPEDIEKNAIAVLAGCTLSWLNIQLDGEHLPCSMENARKIYTRFPWIYEQVSDFVADRRNYLRD